MNARFVVRGTLVALTILALAAALVVFVRQGELDRALEETPPPPTIPAPRGALPGGPVGLLERR